MASPLGVDAAKSTHLAAMALDQNRKRSRGLSFFPFAAAHPRAIPNNSPARRIHEGSIFHSPAPYNGRLSDDTPAIGEVRSCAVPSLEWTPI
jgi:hypothetical protein